VTIKSAPKKSTARGAAKVPVIVNPKVTAAKKPAVKKASPRKPVAEKSVAAQKCATPKGKALDAPDTKLGMSTSRQFVSWLYEANASFAFTTYQSGKVFFIGLQPEGRLSIFERTFKRCMGLTMTDTGFYMSSLYQLWRFENILSPGQGHEGYDRAYLPINGYTTGDLDIHDIAVDGQGRPVFVNTLFSCLATISDKNSFVPL